MINFESSNHEVFLNPRFGPEEKIQLHRLAQETISRYVKKPVILIASSGTTSESWRSLKLFPIPKENILFAAQKTANFLKMTSQDVVLETLPEFHIGGVLMQARAFISKAKWLTSIGAWNAEKFYEFGQANFITALSLVPTQIFDLVKLKKKPWPTLRFILVGGASLEEELLHEAAALGWPLILSYGMTETCAFFAYQNNQSIKRAYRLLDHIQLKIDENQNICLKSKVIPEGYATLNNSNQVIWNPLLDPEGWYQTQDRGYLESENLILLGRTSDNVKVNGEWVDLPYLRKKLLNFLQKFPEHYLLAIPDTRKGAKLVVAVTKDEQSLNEEIQNFNLSVLPFERVEVFKVNSIPRTELGKVLEGELKNKLFYKGR